MSTLIKWLVVILAILLLCLIAGAIGGHISPDSARDSYNISYADFIAIMLTAVSVIITVLAAVVAVAAFVGWQSFDARVKSEVASVISKGFEPGQPLHALFSDQRDKASISGVQPIGASFEKDAVEESKGEAEY